MIGCLHIIIVRVGHQTTVKPLPGAPVHCVLLIPDRSNKINSASDIDEPLLKKMCALLDGFGNNFCIEMIM